MDFLILIAMGALTVFIILCIRMLVTSSKAKKKRLTELKAQGVSIYSVFKHVNGLPIAENLACEVLSYQDRLEFKSGTTSIKLPREKITDMCAKTESEIQQQYVSSAGGAVGGAVLFGPLGAMIGGRVKSKETKTLTRYLIITYTGEQGELKYIGFDATDSPSAAFNLIKEFRELNKNSGIQIEL